MFLRAAFILMLCFLASAALAQRRMPLSVEALGHYGKIFKHTTNFSPAVNGPAIGGEVAVNLQTIGQNAWERPYGFPQYGLAVSFVRFNNDSVLGFGIGAMPQVFIPVYKSESFRVDFNLGTGVAYLTKHFDAVKNPRNNVIATGVNNITSFGFRARYQLTPHWAGLLGTSFTHYSTGDARLPNLGINVPAVKLGASYTFNPRPYADYFSADPADKRLTPGFKARFTVARFEAAQRNGPIHTQAGLEVGVFYYLTRWNKLSLSADVFYNSYAYFFMHTQELDRDKNQLLRAIGSTVILEDEVLLGRVGVTGA
ncbi:MAG TPA: acyloxyacyl hydrolase, partial [Chitinophagales bacterium]|nr:acyloxyacyl hydrolase [Chitinophagales bacterium]